MKTKLIAILLTLITLLTMVSCAAEKEEPQEPKTLETETVIASDLWAKATYKEDQTLGSGNKTVTVKVVADGSYVTFTLKTDKENLGDALLDSGLAEGEDGAYGLYIKKVNGILADYDVDQTYWSFQVGGEAQMNGVSDFKIVGGESVELVRTK